jgi:hypothetical protein
LLTFDRISVGAYTLLGRNASLGDGQIPLRGI